VAIPGFKADGHDYLPDAARRGAVAALVTRELSAELRSSLGTLHLVQVDDARPAAGPVAQLVAGEPSHQMDVVGVTGTNGKTTTVFLMEAILRAAGKNPGIMGTVLTRWAGREVVAKETTPSGPSIARQMAQMKADGVDSLAFEVSSHAIDQHRVDGIRFRAMALTNVTQDHLDYHKTMEAYAAVKMSIFERMRDENAEAIGVVNLDDPTGRQLALRLPEKNRLTYGTSLSEADLHAESISLHDDGISIDANFRGRKFLIHSPMHGRFNASNCLTATGLALALGIPIEAIVKGCGVFRGAPGRFEMVEGLPGVKVIVDYAHTPDALIKLLENARGLTRHRLVAIFGCGGDRDRTKRPLMGKAAWEIADEAIITSDNPRTEDPQYIIQEVIGGIPWKESSGRPFRVIPDRREAIGSAIATAHEGDVIVVAGKGHEDYQIIGTTKTHFDDREVAREFIRQKNAQKTGQAEAIT